MCCACTSNSNICVAFSSFERGRRNAPLAFGAPVISRCCIASPPSKYACSRRNIYCACTHKNLFVSSQQVGVKSRFVGYGDGGACTVESLVLQHLSQREEGSWAGWHCEGSPLRALWALLMWDVIFSPQPNVFQVRGVSLCLSCRTLWNVLRLCLDRHRS